MDELGDTQQIYLDRPKLAARQVVEFWAKDPSGKREILLDGKKLVYAVPGLHCWHYIQVTVTSRPKSSMWKMYNAELAKRIISWKQHQIFQSRIFALNTAFSVLFSQSFSLSLLPLICWKKPLELKVTPGNVTTSQYYTKVINPSAKLIRYLFKERCTGSCRNDI